MSKFFKITTVVASKTSNSGWLNATVHLVDGNGSQENGKKISFPPALTEFGAAPGLYVNLVPSKSEYNDYLVVGMQMGGEKRGDTEKKQGYGSGGGGSKPTYNKPTGGGSSAGDKDFYFQKKFEHEMESYTRYRAEEAVRTALPFYLELFKQNPTVDNISICVNQLMLHAKHIDRTLSGDMNAPSLKSTPAAPPPVQAPPVSAPTPQAAAEAPWVPDALIPSTTNDGFTDEADLPF